MRLKNTKTFSLYPVSVNIRILPVSFRETVKRIPVKIRIQPFIQPFSFIKIQSPEKTRVVSGKRFGVKSPGTVRVYGITPGKKSVSSHCKKSPSFNLIVNPIKRLTVPVKIRVGSTGLLPFFGWSSLTDTGRAYGITPGKDKKTYVSRKDCLRIFPFSGYSLFPGFRDTVSLPFLFGIQYSLFLFGIQYLYRNPFYSLRIFTDR